VPSSKPSSRDRWRLGLAIGAVLLAAADTYVVVVALPSIMNGVGVGLDRLQRATPIISGFLLGYTAILPLIGRLADLAGTGPVFAGCLGAFTAGSVVTATSHTLPVAVFGRALQGLGGGGLLPVTLAMVAARWPPDERGLPLGVVGAVQEFGSVIGPLYGAAIVAVASWRAIFWINVPVAGLTGLGLWLTSRRGGGPAGVHRVEPGRASEDRGASPPTVRPPRAAGRPDLLGAGLALAALAGLLLGLDAPASLATSTTFGQAWAPVASGPWAPFTTPIMLASLGVLLVFVLWELAAPARIRPLVSFGQAGQVLGQADVPGSLVLAAGLACVVVLFSTADPSRQVVASSAPLLGPAVVVLAVLFWWRQRKAAVPLIPRGTFGARPAWGALAVNLALGGALMAALVGVPLFARATVDPDSEVGAAAVLIRFLIAVPIGAVLGGALCRGRARARASIVAAAGMALSTTAFVAMSSWSATALGGAPRWSDVELIACGLGFGLAIAPINVAILGAVPPTAHALASALAVVARTVGMLAGLSALAAIALRRFYEAQAKIGSPLTLCPSHPTNCPAYTDASNRAIISELHTIFAGAAVCAGVACVLALALLSARSTHVSADAGGTTTSSALPRPTG
jgi:MFS family permease